MRSDIILIGPLAAGKTSVALYLSARLRIPNYPLDRIKWYYRFRNGYDLARGTVVLRTEGFKALMEYAKPFFTLMDLQRFLVEFQDGIIDFGASQSVFEDPESLEGARRVLLPFKNVVLLLPSPDSEASIEVLSRRIRERYGEQERSPKIVESYVTVNREYVLNPSNTILAKHIVYTEHKSVEETGEEVLALIGRNLTHGDGHFDAESLETWAKLRNFLPPFA